MVHSLAQSPGRLNRVIHGRAGKEKGGVKLDARMSASGYKQTFFGVCQRVRFTPNSGHSQRSSEGFENKEP